MKKRTFLFICAALVATFLSCNKVGESTGPEGFIASSTDPAKGLAIYIADPGRDVNEGVSCQIDLSKIRPVGKPLTEADIDYYDPNTGRFKLKVMQYDWLMGNLKTILGLRRYSAAVITVDGKPAFGGYTFTSVDSYMCQSDETFFHFGTGHLAPNPKRPDANREENYWIKVEKVVFPNTPKTEIVPKLNASVLQRLEKIDKLKK